MKSLRGFVLACALGPLPFTAHAQVEPTPPGVSTLSVKVQVVALNTLVRSPDKELVRDLNREDFVLRVDGHPTDLKYFSRDNDLPLTVGLLVDTSGSQRVFFDEEARASDVFLREMLTTPQDRALVAHFDSDVALLQPMTARLPDLHNALRQLDYLDPRKANHTRLFDAVAEVSRVLLRAESGRRALVLLTDGDDNGSQAKLADAFHAAQLADVAVYGVLYTNDMIGTTRYPSAPGHVSGIDIMQGIARATGGRTFIVGTGTPIAQIYASIAEDLRSQYRLGFTPPASTAGKYHTISLATHDKHQGVQARAGFYTPD